MMTEPGYSPWGEIQHCDMLTPGIYSVSTAGHGGIMARMDVARKTLSKAALDCAYFECGWYCFEEDCAAAVALRELMDKGLFTAPVNEYYAPGEYEKLIDGSAQRYYPQYWEARKQTIEQNKGQDTPPAKKEKERER